MTIESFLQKQQDTYEALFYLVEAVHAEVQLLKDDGHASYELTRRMTDAVDILKGMNQQHDPRRKGALREGLIRGNDI